MDVLTDDVLHKVLQACVAEPVSDASPALFRWFRTTAPLVCRRWRALLEQPTPVWAAIPIDIPTEAARQPPHLPCSIPPIATQSPPLSSSPPPRGSSPPRARPATVAADAILPWLRKRAPSVHALALHLTPDPTHTFQPRHFPPLCSSLRRSLASLTLLNPAPLCSRDAWDALSLLKSLTALTIASCPVDFLEVGLPVLKFLPLLRSLSLSMARDDPSEPRAAPFPTQLTALSLSYLHMQSSTHPHASPALTPLPNLAALHLSSCHITNHDLLAALVHPPALRTLSIQASVTAPSAAPLPHLPNLTSLQYTATPFPQLPPFTSPPVALAALDLSCNPPTALPPSLHHLPALRSLTLAHCSLTALPPLLATAPHLTHLDISNNSLSSLPQPPPPFAPTLRALNISRNRLPALPPWVWSCTALTSLTASTSAAAGTPAFDEAALALPHLTTLHLVGPSYHVDLVTALLRLTHTLHRAAPARALDLRLT